MADSQIAEGAMSTDDPGPRVVRLRAGNDAVELQIELVPAAVGWPAPPVRHLDTGFFESVLAASPDLTVVYDLGRRQVVWCNSAVREMTGYTLEELLQEPTGPFGAIFDERELARLTSAVLEVKGLPDGRYVGHRARVTHRDGRARWISTRLTPFRRDHEGAVSQCLATVREVTEIVEAEENLTYRALHDVLTGLPNRTLVTDRLRTAINRCARGGDVAIVFCDLDGFKRVNDGAGHAAGDEVLRVVGDRLCAAVRPSDTVGRIGGDEFVVIVEDRQDAVSAAIAVAQRIAARLEQPVVRGNNSWRITASVGIAALGVGEDVHDLLSRADAAMYRAKRQGKARYVVDEPAARGETGVSSTEMRLPLT